MLQDGPLTRLASKLIYIKGKPMNVKDYGLFRPFYNTRAMKCLLKTGRQVGKTTALAAKQTLVSSLKPYTRILTLLPLAEQSRRFSRLYVEEMLRESPILSKRISTKLSNTMTLKELNNGSHLHFWYAGDNADRTRGISVQQVYWDEIQDIICDNISTAEQCTSAYQNPLFNYSGTPKTLDNTIEGLWKRTTQCEPFIKCSRCNFDNFCIIPDVYKMIVPAGLTCQKCKRVLNMNDVYEADYQIIDESKVGIFEGYHIPQIFVPENLHEGRWKKINIDFEDYSEFEFATEVLGISFDTGGRPVTLEQLISCCTEREFGIAMPGEHTVYLMGVDWGYATSRSLTVITVIGVRHNGLIDVVFAKKFKYRDRLDQRQEILDYYKQYNCQAIGCDHGVGFTDNLELRKQLGFENVCEFHYGGGSGQKHLRYLQEQSMYSTDRTKTLGLLFNDILKKHIFFPKFKDFSTFFDDILSIYEEVRVGPRGENKFYARNPKMPDDFIHALNFAVLTARLLTNDTILSSILLD